MDKFKSVRQSGCYAGQKVNKNPRSRDRGPLRMANTALHSLPCTPY